MVSIKSTENRAKWGYHEIKHGPNWSENWDRVFGKKPEKKPEERKEVKP